MPCSATATKAVIPFEHLLMVFVAFVFDDEVRDANYKG